MSRVKDTRPLLRAMMRVATDYWEDINKAVTALVGEVHTDESPQTMYSTAFDTIVPDDALGCGYWGCVFPIDLDFRLVVKITIDPSEGPFVSKLLSEPFLRGHQGIVYYLKVWQLPEELVYRGKTHPIYVIVREEAIAGLSSVVKDTRPIRDILYGYVRNKDYRQVKGYLQTAIHLKEKQDLLVQKGPGKGNIRQYKFDRAEEDFFEIINNFSNRHHSLGAVEDFIIQMWDDQIILADIHLDNLGLRRHDLSDLKDHEGVGGANEDYYIITDPGYSNVYDYPEIEILP